jgi:gamma-glutamyltranspeptidase / glutathione hydrolase
VAALQARGDKVVSQPPFTSANSIAIVPDGSFVGAADPRRDGSTAAGY